MLNPYDSYRKNYLKDNNLFSQTDAEDTELAYLLQQDDIHNQEIFVRLVQLTAARLYPWAALLMQTHSNRVPLHDEVILFLQQVYLRAMQRTDEFNDYSNVNEWLFSIAYQLSLRSPITGRENGVKTLSKYADQGLSYIEKGDGNHWKDLDNLPRNLRLSIYLRNLYDLGTLDISNILKQKPKEVQDHLFKARRQILFGLQESHMDKKVQSYIDCSLEGNQGQVAALEYHLTECEECQAYITKFTEMEQAFREQMKERWVFHPQKDVDISQIVGGIITSMNQRDQDQLMNLPMRKIAWVLGFSLMFVILAFVFVRLTPSDPVNMKRIPTPIPNLPPAVQLQTSPKTSGELADLSRLPSYVEPAFSQDGNWGAFSLIKHDPSTQGILLPTIELFNRNTSVIKIIHESNAILNMPWLWWNLVPAISSDGAWITFVSSILDADIVGSACKTSTQYDCLDVFLYNRDTGKIIRLTHGVNGEAANGYSLSPAISADGEWIAFWSAATNLVPEPDSACQAPNAPVTCFYVYLINRKTQRIERLPIPSMVRASDFSFDRISLSADGRYIGYTISIEGEVKNSFQQDTPVYQFMGKTFARSRPDFSILDYDNTSEAIVYDRQTGKTKLVNTAIDGDIGNGASYSPMLSADGRFVAFVSESTNLVIKDTNQYSDVFLLDQQNMEIERVSVSSSGAQGNGNSGFMQFHRGFYSLDISPNGRYISYISVASNLDHNNQNQCTSNQDCSFLYFYDRESGKTETVDTFTNGDYSRYPNISSNGRWVAFMDTTRQCGSEQSICSNVMLYDRQNKWMTNLTKFDAQTAQLPWSFTGNIALPWELWETKALAFSQDGSLFALAGMDSKVRLWRNVDRSELITTNTPQIFDPKTNDALTVLAFNQDSSWLAAGSTGGDVYIWNLPNRELIYSIKDDPALIKNIVFSKDSSQLIISAANSISIWQIQAKQLIQFKRFRFGQALVVSPIGNRVASANADGTIWVQSLPAGKLLGRISIGQDLVRDLSFSADGSNLAVVSTSGTISLWQLSPTNAGNVNIMQLNTIESTEFTGEIVFSPDNQYITSTSENGSLIIWRIDDGKRFSITSSYPYYMINSLAYSRNGNRLAAIAENQILFWELPVQNSFSYFLPSSKDQYVDISPFSKLIQNDIPQYFEPRSFSNGLQVNLTRAVDYLNFTPMIPTRLPEDFEFVGAMINGERSILLNFSTPGQLGSQASLFLLERSMKNNESAFMVVGNKAEVIPIPLHTMLGSAGAEYVSGDWVFSHSITPPIAGSLIGQLHNTWQWDVSSVSQRLRWQQNNILFSLYYRVNSEYISVLRNSIKGGLDRSLAPLLDQGDLIQIADSLRWYTQVENPNLR